MLAVLLEKPRDALSWQRWSLHHRHDHEEIRQAIQTQKGTNLPEYELDPMPRDLNAWIDRNQRTHLDMNSTLGLQSSDLGTLDMKNDRTLELWIRSHYLEHFSARAALGI